MFVPKKMIRVLLVESDDSTRQIIAALLRKCNYRVAAVGDGLKAWEMLKKRPRNVDLILTEVELPSISGYPLLTLIMEHDICKRIPVIMMSSKDSISLVLKCMLKGAVDFLIKPIRKNNLKNLWQHVWRRQINEARNVPECKNVALERVGAASDNDVENNHSGDNLASTIKTKHCRKKCSDSQSCCGTPYFGAETACTLNMPIKLHMKLDSASTASNIGEHEECAEMVKKSAMPESDSVDTDATPTGKLDQYGEVASYHGAHIVGMGLQQGHTCVKQMVKPEDSLGENAYFPGESSCQTRAIAATASGTTDLIGNLNHSPDDLDGHVHGDDETKKVNVIPELELSLTRMDPGYTKHETTEHHTLFHSKASAFSRYDSSKTLEPRVSAPAKSRESLITLVLGQSGQPEAAFPGPHLGFVQIPGGRSESVYPGYGYLYPPVYYMQALSPFWNHKSQHEESHLPESSSVHSASEVNNQEQTFYMNKKSTPNASDRDVLLDDKRSEMARVIKHGSLALDLCSGLTSNVSNDVNCITKEENSSAVSGIARPSESVNDNHLLIRDGQQGKDSSQISLREAALMKFRLKRKERCFEKKVRYQSRKRLAEERPRVKGQFVRQDSSSK